jgi:hypothetical protein
VALKPCINGFKGGCRPYLSTYSSFLIEKRNGQLAACNVLDEHNLMFHVCYWQVSIKNRTSMDMFCDAVEKMLRSSVTFGSPHICMQFAGKFSKDFSSAIYG